MGLQLNRQQCFVFLVGNASVDEIRSLVTSLGERFVQLAVARYTKYLGVMIGPEGERHAWDMIIPKLFDRALDVKRANLGPSLAVGTCHALCLSLLQYVLQFHPPSRQLLVAYHRCAQLLTNGPWNAMPRELLEGVGLGFVTFRARALRRVRGALRIAPSSVTSLDKLVPSWSLMSV